jgi:hypothetical protein
VGRTGARERTSLQEDKANEMGFPTWLRQDAFTGDVTRHPSIVSRYTLGPRCEYIKTREGCFKRSVSLKLFHHVSQRPRAIQARLQGPLPEAGVGPRFPEETRPKAY